MLKMLTCVRESHNHIVCTTLENTGVSSRFNILCKRYKLCFSYNTLLMDIFASYTLSLWIDIHLVAKSKSFHFCLLRPVLGEPFIWWTNFLERVMWAWLEQFPDIFPVLALRFLYSGKPVPHHLHLDFMSGCLIFSCVEDHIVSSVLYTRKLRNVA